MKAFLVAITIIWNLSAHSQTIRGTIFDENTHEPLVAVNIIIEGTNLGSSTDKEGQFELEIQNGATIKLSYIGYNDHRILNIQSEEKVIDLGEIVLLEGDWDAWVTYSIQNKRGKTKTICKYEYEKRKYTDKELEVRCPNGSLKLKWEKTKKNELSVDFNKISDCFD